MVYSTGIFSFNNIVLKVWTESIKKTNNEQEKINKSRPIKTPSPANHITG